MYPCNSDLKYSLAQIERNKGHRQKLQHGVDESYVLFRLQIGVVYNEILAPIRLR